MNRYVYDTGEAEAKAQQAEMECRDTTKPWRCTCDGTCIDATGPELCPYCVDKGMSRKALELDRHSPLWQVIELLLRSHENLMPDSDWCYSHDSGPPIPEDSIGREEVQVIINHLKHGGEWSAIDYSDFQNTDWDGAS